MYLFDITFIHKIFSRGVVFCDISAATRSDAIDICERLLKHPEDWIYSAHVRHNPHGTKEE